MKNIEVNINTKQVGDLFYLSEQKEFGFNYIDQISPISLVMPFKKSTYLWRYHLHPIFEMNLPEGYLFEIFKNILAKEYGYVDDFLIFSYLSPNIQGRLTYTTTNKKDTFQSVDLDDILQNDSSDTFSKLVQMFLNKNAISGVQPKTLAIVSDKGSLNLSEYIVKTWGEEFPNLAENEYFCLKAVEKSGVTIPDIKISKNKKFLLVKKFDYDTKNKQFLGFEEILGLMGKNRDKKYSGSYEQVAKIIYAVTTEKETSMRDFYKTIVMNFLLKNGDAHLKNFGILYNSNFSKIWFAPSYDIVNTVCYIHKDKPALTMFGKKIWLAKDELIVFGTKHCMLSPSVSKKLYKDCLDALMQTKADVTNYIEKNEAFKEVGNKMIDIFNLSLEEKTYKEIPNELIRNWNKFKKA